MKLDMLNQFKKSMDGAMHLKTCWLLLTKIIYYYIQYYYTIIYRVYFKQFLLSDTKYFNLRIVLVID